MKMYLEEMMVVDAHSNLYYGRLLRPGIRGRKGGGRFFFILHEENGQNVKNKVQML